MGGERQRETADQRIGANVRSLRDQKGLSQKELARLMTERGHLWHQSTVTRVEHGLQPLGAAELVDLAAILHTSLDRFTWTQPEAGATEYVYSAGSRVKQDAETVSDAVFRLLLSLASAERTLEMTKDSEYPRVQEARRDTADRIETCGLDEAVDEGIRRYEEREGAEEGDDDDSGPDEERQPGVMDKQ